LEFGQAYESFLGQMLDSVVRQHKVMKLHQSRKGAILHIINYVLRELPEIIRKLRNKFDFGQCANLQNPELFALFQVWDLTELVCTQVPENMVITARVVLWIKF